MQTKTIPSFNSRRARIGVSCFVILLAFPLVLYFGYCWGLWGRNSLLLQHLWQCTCSSSSEEWRYPKQADVLISACRSSSIELSPSGRFLDVKEQKLAYLMDLQTGDRIDVSKQPDSIFLTDDLGFIQYPESYLVHRMTGKQYPIRKFAYWQQGAYIMGEANLDMLAIALQESHSVFFDEYGGTLIALAPDHLTRPEHNFYLPRSDFPGNRDQMKQFMQESSIAYQTINNNFPGEVLSPDGKLVARNDGIYFVETNQLIVPGIPRLLVRGWIPNGVAAIYTSHSFRPCLLRLALPMGDDTWCEIRVPQPVIKLNVPEAYLLPTSP